MLVATAAPIVGSVAGVVVVFSLVIGILLPVVLYLKTIAYKTLAFVDNKYTVTSEKNDANCSKNSFDRLMMRLISHAAKNKPVQKGVFLLHSLAV